MTMVIRKSELMKNKIKFLGLILGLFTLLFVGCEDDIDPVIENLNFDRVFTPINLEAQIRNKLTAELTWDLSDSASSYVVEISQDSLEFNSIIKTVEVAPDEIPVSITLEGEEQYSARVKGVSSSLEESKWATVVFETDAENIFNTLADGSIGKTQVMVTWPESSEVTHFIISTDGADDVRRDITEAEVAAGEATITGLAFGTDYGITMYNDPSPKQRGHVDFTTLPEGQTLTSDMDLNEAINTTFVDQDVFLLEAGEYSNYTGTLTLNRSIKLKGLSSEDKPVVHVQFVLEDGVQNVEIADLEMNGSYIDPATSEAVILDHAFQYNTSGVNYGSLIVSGCKIHDYNKSLFSGSSSIKSKIESISMDNCYVTNILTNSADCIDFRASYVGALSLTNSTYVNCAPSRDFIRLDDTSEDYPGLVTDVLVDHCTLYGVSNSSSKRVLYVRFVDNTLTVTNTLIAETVGFYTNQSRSSQPECSNNNYFNAGAFVPGGTDTSGALFDQSGNYTTLDPGFADAANGDFSVTNQTLIDNAVGDPRWR